MSTISIIGAGNIAAAIGTRAAQHGHRVELLSRDAGKTRALADRIGEAATVGTYGDVPRGDVVVLAVLYEGAVDAVTAYGDALAGKTLVDITNPFNADGSGLVTTPGDSMADRIAAAVPESTHVVKALNTVFGHVLARDTALDALLAGDGAEAKAQVAAFLESLGLRPLDAGGLELAHALEWAGLLLVGVARSGAGFDTALGVQDR